MTTTTTTFASATTISRTAVFSIIGASVIALAAQIQVPIPGTPVPMTLQTMAVLALPLFFGLRKGAAAVLVYLTAGLLGAPVFSGFSSLTALWGTTSGYLLGFVAAAVIVGLMRDKGLTTTWIGRTIALVLGTAAILLPGATVLSTFVGVENFFTMGIAPFVTKDIATIATLALAGGIRGSR